MSELEEHSQHKELEDKVVIPPPPGFWTLSKSKADREPELEEPLAAYLRENGVDIEVVMATSKGLFGTSTEMRIVELTGQNINNIFLVRGTRGAGSAPPDPAQVQFHVRLDRPLTKDAKKAVTAKSKIIIYG